MYSYVGLNPMNASDPTGMFENCTAVSGSPGAFSCPYGGMADTKPKTMVGGNEKVTLDSAVAGVAGTAGAAGSRGGIGGAIKPKAGDVRFSIITWAVKVIEQNTLKSVKIDVYRVFDNEKAVKNGRSWTPQDPRTMKDWRNELAVYPEWNKGTYVVHGQVTQLDLFLRKVDPKGTPGSIAGAKEYNKDLGGGPYDGTGIEWYIYDPTNTVKNQRVYIFKD